jgi:hypothetical protein
MMRGGEIAGYVLLFFEMLLGCLYFCYSFVVMVRMMKMVETKERFENIDSFTLWSFVKGIHLS